VGAPFRRHDRHAAGALPSAKVTDCTGPVTRTQFIFTVTTVIQKETGGNLAELLDGIARTIRERYKFHGKVRALTAEGRSLDVQDVEGRAVRGAWPWLSI
jgi:Flp pilus assembly protein TadB